LQLKKFREELEKMVQEKLDCLKQCKKGFSVKAYTETRAKSAIDSLKVKTTSNNDDSVSPIGITHPELLQKLIAWRNKKAKELNVPHYLIMHQKTIHQIIGLLPVSYAKLNLIKGLGKKKIQDFGAEILDIVRTYTKEKKIETGQYDEIPEQKKEKTDTKKISYDLYKTGKTIAEIAREREMTQTTIEGHLAHYVGIGELSVETFVPNDKIVVISQYFLNNNSPMLGPAKEALGEGYSYGELKMVLKHLQYKGELKGEIGY
jgi:ribonuclease D